MERIEEAWAEPAQDRIALGRGDEDVLIRHIGDRANDWQCVAEPLHADFYERCVEGAPLNSEETGPDISRADFVFCMTAITWGWNVAETADRLMEESAKAQASGKTYADLTARNAALAVQRRRQQPRHRDVG